MVHRRAPRLQRAIVVACFLLMLSGLLIDAEILRLTALIAMLLPGYFIATSLSLRDHRPGFFECLALAGGVDLVLLIVGGIVFHFLSVPLDRYSWTVWILTCLAGASLIRDRAEATPGLLTAREAGRPPHPVMKSILLASLSLGLVAAAYAIASWSALRQDGSIAFTQFWIEQDAPASGSNLRIGVRNDEGRLMSYRITVSAPEELVFDSPPISLAPDSAWSLVLPVQPAWTGQRLEARLYAPSTADLAYRRVWLVPR